MINYFLYEINKLFQNQMIKLVEENFHIEYHLLMLN
jgi:hypothetical protein